VKGGEDRGEGSKGQGGVGDQRGQNQMSREEPLQCAVRCQ
jgi:hypothetical protein